MYETPVYLAGCDLCDKGHIRLAAYLREMQKAACLDLNNFDLTPELLHEMGIAFILSKTSLVVEKTNLPSAELTLKTYPRQTTGASFMRDFVFSQNGEVVARATTRWGILNLNTRRLVRPSELPRPIPGESELWVGFEPPRLAAAKSENAALLGCVTVPRCMTDANAHLNNAAYLDLCLNVDADLAFSEMHIEYRKEVKEGEQLAIYKSENDDGSYLLYGEKTETGELSFLVELHP
ncbi:MAG: hypothetical protein IKT43_03085 [Clostridia bacterium]|nr:hypothetical protein [Clostridia bacterium]